MSDQHRRLLKILPTRPTDYKPWGEVERWEEPGAEYSDCSSGCKWAVWLRRKGADDWCVCSNPNSPRVGLLTFEHQAGHECFEAPGPTAEELASQQLMRISNIIALGSGHRSSLQILDDIYGELCDSEEELE